MPHVRIGEGESLETALKKFRKQCTREGIISEVKKREYFDKPSIKRRKKSENARKKKLKQESR